MRKEDLNGIFDTMKPNEAQKDRMYRNITEPVKDTATRGFGVKRAFAPLGACILCVAIGLTAYAALAFLKPAEVAEKVGESEIARLFQSERAVEIGETVRSGDYEITLLGAAQGKELREFTGVNFGATGFGWDIVAAVRRMDGKPIGDIDNLHVSTLFKSFEGWDNAYQTVNHGTTSENGVLYLVASADAFGSYLMVSDADNDQAAFDFDEYSFALTPKADYKGVNAVFKTEKTLATMWVSSPKEHDEWLASDEYAQMQKDEAYYNGVPLSECELIPESVKIVPIGEYYYLNNADDMVGYRIQPEMVADDNNFDENGICRMGRTENNAGAMIIIAYRRNGDGTVTGMAYRAPKRAQ